MDFKQYQVGNGEGGKRTKPEGPPAPSYLSNILTILLVFLLLVSAYSFFAERKEETEVVSLSQLAVDIRQQQVKEVAIDGTDLPRVSGPIVWGESTSGTPRRIVSILLSHRKANRFGP